MLVFPGGVTWSVSDNRDNATTTATRVADANGRSHYITGVLASYSAARVGEVVITCDATTLGRMFIHNEGVLQFSQPLIGNPGAPVSVTLAASGAPGTFGAVTLIGYTR